MNNASLFSLRFFLLLSLIIPYASLKAAIKESAPLEEALNQRQSATATLQNFCNTNIYIDHIDINNKNIIPDEVIKKLNISDNNTIKIRHVHLKCAHIIYSDAWNYYVPSRLPNKTQKILLTTNIPFGRALGEKNFLRLPLSQQESSLKPPFILQNRAVLFDKTNHLPLAFIIENYTKNALHAAQKYQKNPTK